MKTNWPLSPLVLALVLVTGAVSCWEIFLRNKKIRADFDDGPELWADRRGMVYQPSDKATIFIGSSRIKYDLDIDTWQSITGTGAIQLAMVGSSPLTMLKDLADDANFKGKLLVDVTEVLFFNQSPGVLQKPDEAIGYYHKRTPAQKASFAIDKLIEPRLAMLNRDFYSLNGLLDHLHIPNRRGVLVSGLDFPVGFAETFYNRQTKMTNTFLRDTARINKVRKIWGSVQKRMSAPPVSGKALDAILLSVKHDINKIQARGGEVVFLRTPSSGPFLLGENKGYPRSKYWDKLLAVTHCRGIHFSDYATIRNLVCPEFSHLKRQDAVIYTKGIITILKKQTDWKL